MRRTRRSGQVLAFVDIGRRTILASFLTSQDTLFRFQNSLFSCIELFRRTISMLGDRD